MTTSIYTQPVNSKFLRSTDRWTTDNRVSAKRAKTIPRDLSLCIIRIHSVSDICAKFWQTIVSHCKFCICAHTVNSKT